MDFLQLFDPCPPDETCDVHGDITDQLPPEPQVGNVEYKLKLVNPSKQRFEHLVTQMKWRLREGQGEAIYEIGVEDSGVLTGLAEYEMTASLQTLQQMAYKLGATTTILRERLVDGDNVGGRKVAEVLVRKVPDDQHNIEVRVAVMGSADAGKSTLLGVLTQGQLDNGRGRARLNMFRHLHEVQSGRTSSISHEILGFDTRGHLVNYSEFTTAEEICENSTKLVTFIDLAGHRKYLRTTVLGLTGYSPHHVMLVVSGSAGIVGMTQEHLALATALDVPFFITITKTDVTTPADTLLSLEAMLKSAGCRKVPLVVTNEDDVITAGSNQLAENIVPIFCVSNVTGDGLELLTKFLHVLPPGISVKEKERLEQELCEFQIDETFRVPEVGTVVGGLLIKGVVAEGVKLVVGPLNDGRFLPVTVQSAHRNKAPCRIVRASQSASLGLNREVPGLRNGMVLLSPESKPVGCLFFQAAVCVLFHATAIYPGFQTTVHIGNIRQTAVIEGIMASGGIHTNDRASALFRFLRHPEYVKVGMRLLFREGRTKGIGKITQVFPVQQD
ncbi:GTP-binding protein 2 isoform X1 [Zootermopsis nevadensis]|uniref:GTP-binding protein 2 n=1 Tax=Zootermopsis nevadensis TaxID=136037 RepID=A0A067RCX3_ZOONE|nr:GTP-binding protein 2 isoform X1 [Zootermopsis nevadensis]XP_021915437.1 GTP-binding protein 2 isoform X1 [Zootermopsis nevadensis]XP_021915440.1 GTP-binding protein 2 isoform X1 [Zootermopsis nevadensis]XP_021915441.1 GTP-binding protein 2 isoform X1 [Zootermopsis nevadensis]XP_021915442.1 GTP-binding protein 2 isoform X1 [Zootermopsis nevadensis]XP_021915443.1 GTP-binding protein 2 isoform X1 [Zootermopsis nevadensis]XP_021915444.1 GTP-binding protein 2 isoform X1 [Zootermopsis nevadensi